MEPMIAPTRPPGRGRLALLAVALVVCGAWAAGQRPKPARAPQAPHPTPAPPFEMRRDSILGHKDKVIAHFRSLAFETAPNVDRRRVSKPDSAGALVPADTAELSSEVGAKLVTGTWRQDGRVFARVTYMGDSYPALRLHRGINYVCVRRSTPHASGNLWAFVIGAGMNGNEVNSVDSLRIKAKPLGGAARFTTTPNDEGMCFPCNSMWCCSQE